MSDRRLDLHAVYAVVKKEFLDNVRSRWIIGISLIFVILTLIMSYFGAAQTQGRTGFQGLSETVIVMVGVIAILVPILALMLSYATIVGEKESGSLLLLLAMPITRTEAMIGKFLGLSAVLLTSILAGLGISGVVVVAFAGTEGWTGYIAFVLASALFALAFLSLGLFLSVVARRRSTAIGLAVLTWFLLAVIYDTALFGVFIATGGTFDFTSGVISLPDWYWGAMLFSPVDTIQVFTMLVFGITSVFGFRAELPGFVTVWMALATLTAWTVIPLVLAFWRFRRQDM